MGININQFYKNIDCPREFTCAHCGAHVYVTDVKDKRVKYCSAACEKQYWREKSKQDAGIRKIPISEKIVDLFKDNIDNSKEYFFFNKKGNKYEYFNFKFQFEKMLDLLGLERHTIHDTRHTFATLLNNANANSTSIIKLIGHSDFSTTENIYTHKDIEELRKAVNLLN